MFKKYCFAFCLSILFLEINCCAELNGDSDQNEYLSDDSSKNDDTIKDELNLFSEEDNIDNLVKNKGDEADLVKNEIDSMEDGTTDSTQSSVESENFMSDLETCDPNIMKKFPGEDDVLKNLERIADGGGIKEISRGIRDLACFKMYLPKDKEEKKLFEKVKDSLSGYISKPLGWVGKAVSWTADKFINLAERGAEYIPLHKQAADFFRSMFPNDAAAIQVLKNAIKRRDFGTMSGIAAYFTFRLKDLIPRDLGGDFMKQARGLKKYQSKTSGKTFEYKDLWR